MSDPARLRRLRWRARRGLLENDLVLARFFELHGERLTEADVTALDALLDLGDDDLLALVLGRGRPQDLDPDPAVHRVLEMLRSA